MLVYGLGEWEARVEKTDEVKGRRWEGWATGYRFKESERIKLSERNCSLSNSPKEGRIQYIISHSLTPKYFITLTLYHFSQFNPEIVYNA
jgi:hypothetical protein